MEQGTGVEPAFTAWEAVVLPIYEPCMCGYYSRANRKKQPLFVEKVFLLPAVFFRAILIQIGIYLIVFS